jgi:hypothetical protein
MDIEWAKDGETGELAIVQARPETVQSRKDVGTLKTYRLKEEGDRKLVSGLAIGDSIAPARSAASRAPRRSTGSSRRGSRHRHDRSGLGADHEEGRRHRHRSRRPHQPCGHRQPRARPARPSSAPAMPPRRSRTGQERSPCPAPRATRARLFGHRRLRRARDRHRRHPEDPHQGHGQPGQSRRRRSAGGGCRPTVSGSPAWSSSSGI